MIKGPGYLEGAVISIVAEYTIAFDTPFIGRFGFSALLELKAASCEKQILYDTNSAAAPILHNLGILGKSLDKLSTIFLSHIVKGQTVQDHERDDAAVILNFQQGLVIVTGCCHAGIVNTMAQAKRITGVDKIYAVIGGLHFIGASEEKIEKSIEALCEVDWVFAGHCTGFDGLRRIANTMGDRFGQIQTGTIIHLPVKGDSPLLSTIPTAVRDLNRSFGE